MAARGHHSGSGSSRGGRGRHPRTILQHLSAPTRTPGHVGTSCFLAISPRKAPRGILVTQLVWRQHRMMLQRPRKKKNLPELSLCFSSCKKGECPSSPPVLEDSRPPQHWALLPLKWKQVSRIHPNHSDPSNPNTLQE